MMAMMVMITVTIMVIIYSNKIGWWGLTTLKFTLYLESTRNNWEFCGIPFSPLLNSFLHSPLLQQQAQQPL